MQNKQKALELIEDNYQTEDMGDAVSTDIAYEAIELASKPDWFHPSKGEFPDEVQEVWIERFDNCCRSNLKDFYMSDKQWWIDNVKVWTYLPTYKKD